eukprot:gene4123-58_t
MARTKQLEVACDLDQHSTLSPTRSTRATFGSENATPVGSSAPCTPLQKLDVNQEISSPRSAKRKHGQSEPVTAEERHPKREKDEKKCAIGASEISKKQQLPQRTISTTDLRLTRDRSFSVSQKVKGVYRSLSQRTRQRLQRHKPTPSRQYHGEPESYRGEFQLWYRSVSEDERMNVPKIEQQRREAIFELIHHEKTFLDQVSETLNVYPGYMVKLAAITAEKREAIFFRLADIRDLHKSFYEGLEEAAKNGMEKMYIGDLFSKWIPTCADIYSDYLDNQPKAKMLLEMLCQQSEVFQEIVETARDLPHLRRLDLSALLDLPRQKLTSYQLLLDRILTYTPEDHPDHNALTHAIQLCSSTVQGVDARIKIMSLRAMIAPTEIDESATLLYERKAHFKDDKEANVYVIAQMVVVTKMKKGKEYLHGKLPIPVSSLHFDDCIEGGNDASLLIQNHDYASKHHNKSSVKPGSFRLSRRGSVFGRSGFVLKSLQQGQRFQRSSAHSKECDQENIKTSSGKTKEEE